jgi:hypothetical protein
VAGAAHLHELELQRRKRRQRAADAGAEEGAPVDRRGQPLVQPRREEREQDGAADVQREDDPRPRVGRRGEELGQAGPRARSDRAAEEDGTGQPELQLMFPRRRSNLLVAFSRFGES